MHRCVVLTKTAAAMAAMLFGCACPSSGDAPVTIGSRLELFVDDCLVGRLEGGVERRLHHPVPREVVMDHDEPWEGSGSGYHTIFRDGDRYRMYYKAWHLHVTDEGLEIPHPTFGAYAESRDGVHWTKPELGLFEFEGTKANNIVWAGPGSHDFTPFRDDNPACGPDARYKAVGRGGEGLMAFVSPDGIHWNLLSEEPILAGHAFDSQNLAFRDALRKEYRLYFRDFRDGRRDIMTATSTDFIHWSEPVWLTYPGAAPEQLYTNQIGPYHRAPHIFIGFPARYTEREWSDQTASLPNPEHRLLRKRASERYGSAVTDGLFMSSRDGVTFDRWGEAFLRPGVQSRHNWAYGDAYIAWHLIETPSAVEGAPPELSLFATESYWTGSSSRLRRYTLRLDGFVSVHASPDGGELFTKPLVFDGDSLLLNFATSGAGSIRVEILDEAGQPIPGRRLDDCLEIFGDDIERTVLWKNGGDVGHLAGRPVILRFVMRDADLYSLRFGE